MGRLAGTNGIKGRWQVEVAAMLSQIGSVILPAATLERVYQGHPLSDPERSMVERMPGVVTQILGNIPRLEPVLEILRYQDKCFDGSGPPAGGPTGDAVPWGARALRVALDIDSLERQGLPASLAFDTLRGRKGRYDPEILEALARIRDSAPQSRVSELPLHLLRPGMILAQDGRAETGVLVVARGQELTPGLLGKMHNFFRPGDIIRVITPAVDSLGTRAVRVPWVPHQIWNVCPGLADVSQPFHQFQCPVRFPDVEPGSCPPRAFCATSWL